MSLFDRLRWELATRQGSAGRRAFATALRGGEVARTGISLRPDAIGLDLVSICCAKDTEEQAMSLLTFAHRVGRPRSWTVYHDGTPSPVVLELLRTLAPGLRVAVQPWNVRAPANPGEDAFLHDYAVQSGFGKKAFAYFHHPLTGPTLFLDSDILFYPLAAQLLPAALADGRPWFMPDPPDWTGLDSRYLAAHPRELFVANGGFCLVPAGFSWAPGTAFLRALGGRYERLSDQTAFHVALRAAGAAALDPRVFIIDWPDQFQLGQAFAWDRIAVRHYVSFARHKIWQPGWRAHFGG